MTGVTAMLMGLLAAVIAFVVVGLFSGFIAAAAGLGDSAANTVAVIFGGFSALKAFFVGSSRWLAEH